MEKENIDGQTGQMEDQQPEAPPPVKAEAKITIQRGELEATIKIIPPENGGADLSFPELKIELVKSGVMFGVDNAVLKALADRPAYGVETIIARGEPKRDGVDAELVYYVEANRKLQPKEKDDGTIDFKDIGIVQEVKKGAVLCEKKPRTEGTPGTDVRGRQIAPSAGKDKVLHTGKNTVLSDDGLKLTAELDGHVTIVGGKINVLNVFTVDGNVSTVTGNINFSGNVVVRGDVLQGFSVNATGDVTINGMVESAKVSAGGSLVIRGGFYGGTAGELEVGGNAACMFISGGKVSVNGDLETTYIINSQIKCGKDVRITGKGLIRGGHVMAKTSITVNFIGNESGTPTVIEVGNDPYIPQRFKEVSAEMAGYAKNIADLELGVKSLLKAKEVGQLTPERAAALSKALDTLQQLKAAHTEIREEHEILEKQISELGYGTVNVRKTAYPDVKIIIGPDSTTLQVPHSFVAFTRSRDGKGVVFAPLSKSSL